ncbi:uncharacterized protein LOC120137310 [Hibiscus syriacus]|uniref:uncharacterized protein LOC120137310 n=1 Tax=Hibiscus syriacus TaxID=106335 RepID=UPI00192133D4|nr:uncharacterized protein LOC120137310 [Hibiscus syriacus]
MARDSLVSLIECNDSSPAISYKDAVTKSTVAQSDSKTVNLEDNDIELLEEDITLGSSNSISTIYFSERVQSLAVKSMDLTLVVKVLGRRVGYNTLHNRIYGICKPSYPLKLIDIENNYFLVKFSDHGDYLKVLTEGPWTIFRHYLTVEQWSIDFQSNQDYPSRLMAWIRLPGLPGGSMIKIDFQTDNGCRGRFARLVVSLNLHRPLVSKLLINGRLQIIEYESLPTIASIMASTVTIKTFFRSYQYREMFNQ